jgi:hypothetical protein
MEILYLVQLCFGLGIASGFSVLLYKVRFQLFGKLVQLFIPFVWGFAFFLKLLFKATWP